MLLPSVARSPGPGRVESSATTPRRRESMLTRARGGLGGVPNGRVGMTNRDHPEEVCTPNGADVPAF